MGSKTQASRFDPSDYIGFYIHVNEGDNTFNEIVLLNTQYLVKPKRSCQEIREQLRAAEHVWRNQAKLSKAKQEIRFMELDQPRFEADQPKITLLPNEPIGDVPKRVLRRIIRNAPPWFTQTIRELSDV